MAPPPGVYTIRMGRPVSKAAESDNAVYSLARPATTLFSLAATEQLGHYLFVGDCTGPAGCHPLIMLL